MAGHITRMEDPRIPEMVLNTKPEIRRGVGTSMLRWLDDVEADIKCLDKKDGEKKLKTENTGR
jgi:hypothetical protein